MKTNIDSDMNTIVKAYLLINAKTLDLDGNLINFKQINIAINAIETIKNGWTLDKLGSANIEYELGVHT